MNISGLMNRGCFNMIRGAALPLLLLPVTAVAAFAEIETLSCKMTSQNDQETAFFTLEINRERGSVAHVLENGTTYHEDAIYVKDDLHWSWTAEILPGVSITSRYVLDPSTLSLSATSIAEMGEDEEGQANATEYRGSCFSR